MAFRAMIFGREAAPRPHRSELLRLVNDARLNTPRGVLTIKARDHPAA